MRITTVLYRVNHHRMLKRMWKKQSQMQIAPLEISPELQQLGIKIHDAMDLVKVKNSYDKEPEADVIDPRTLKDYSSMKKFYLFNDDVRITEKEGQMLCLTKSILYPGLPETVTSLIGLEQIPDQDKLVQRSLIQSFVKDSQLVKLPKMVDKERLHWVFPREYGISYERKSANAVEKLSLLCEMGVGKYPNSWFRSKIVQPFSEVVIERGSATVIFQMPAEVLFTTQKPLKPFSPPSEVQGTKDLALPPIYPIKPTLDLEQCEINPARHMDDISILDSIVTSPYHVHTLHIAHKTFDEWLPHQKLDKAIAACFSYAAEEAKRRYGKDVKELPEPVSIQCIYSDMEKIGFIAYQLNTLELSADDGIKNQVWVEEMQNICTQVHEHLVYEVTAIEDYDDTIFPKMLAMYLNGLHPSSL